ncbi:hypothetical protein EBU02_07220 [bacterium]|nr:hypothetical protein [bacterium]
MRKPRIDLGWVFWFLAFGFAHQVFVCESVIGGIWTRFWLGEEGRLHRKTSQKMTGHYYTRAFFES